MFDIGFWELLLISIVALLVIGPSRLPEVARTVGLWVGRAQRMVQSVKSDIQRELENEHLKNVLEEQKKEIDDLKELVDDTRNQIETPIAQFSEQILSEQGPAASEPEIQDTQNTPAAVERKP
ncbi:MAG TPA: twin-arginine translocase subunit TatB [Gammaproteobacteria bacterium]|nr:twin-arginine translocase subunit TatB [Gammaproteobacteria bacterium]